MFDPSLLQNVLEGVFSAAFLASVLRVTTPILLPSLGALISDRAGVINIGLEGIMLIAAFTGVVFSAYAQDWWGMDTGELVGPWLGLFMGVLFGILIALMIGFFHLRLKADLILSGIAVSFLGQAGTVAIMFELTGSRGDTQGFLRSLKMPFIQLPEFLNDIPIVSFFFQVLDNQSIMTWIALVMVGVVWYFMYRTPTGIHLRAVGENPEAAASVGIKVNRIRYLALGMSGFLAALGGIHMSMGYLQFFQNNMTSGRGYVALATPYLGGGHPVGTGLASTIFAFFDALSNRVGTLEVPSMLLQMLPYIATVMALVMYALQNRIGVRVRTLRSAEGEDFDASFWGSIQRLSVLHMFLAMLAFFGLIIGISMLSAPDGFRNATNQYSATDVSVRALGIGLASLALIVINMPFMLEVERIGRWVWFSAVVAVFSLWVYLGILFALYFETTTYNDSSEMLGVITGLILSIIVWLALGGQYLMLNAFRSSRRRAEPST